MGSLMAAYTVAWTVLMIYVLSLGLRQRRLQQALERLTAKPGETQPGTHAR